VQLLKVALVHPLECVTCRFLVWYNEFHVFCLHMSGQQQCSTHILLSQACLHFSSRKMNFEVGLPLSFTRTRAMVCCHGSDLLVHVCAHVCVVCLLLVLVFACACVDTGCNLNDSALTFGSWACLLDGEPC
jgi:hypothetical protein